jgi:hypothetical protein
MQDHTHIEFKGQQISVVNRDGSPSHNTTRDRVPQKVIDFLLDKKLIKECQDISTPTGGVPRGVIDKALGHERFGRLIAQTVAYISRVFGRGV